MNTSKEINKKEFSPIVNASLILLLASIALYFFTTIGPGGLSVFTLIPMLLNLIGAVLAIIGLFKAPEKVLCIAAIILNVTPVTIIIFLIVLFLKSGFSF